MSEDLTGLLGRNASTLMPTEASRMSWKALRVVPIWPLQRDLARLTLSKQSAARVMSWAQT
jgi:hypothetical protein